jgi:hypothetical protein
METGEYNRRGTDVATYVELQPTDRHRSFIDHLFILRDCGRLTDAGRNLFASPMVHLSGKQSIFRRVSDDACGDPVSTAGCWEFDVRLSDST